MTSVRFGNTLNPYPGTVASPTPAIRQGVYGGIKNYGAQQYLPVNNKRELTEPEQADIQAGLKQWTPKWGAGYSTPLTQLLASPTKGAIILGGIMGVFGAIPGIVMAIVNKTVKEAGEKSELAGLAAIMAAVGGIFMGALGAAIGYFGRRQENENILDILPRYAPGATKRDLLSDPVYQADLNRRAAAIRAANRRY
jgi:hypothetical protein